MKDIQQQLRHSSMTTTANIYVQAVYERVRGVVEDVDRQFPSTNQVGSSAYDTRTILKKNWKVL